MLLKKSLRYVGQGFALVMLLSLFLAAAHASDVTPAQSLEGEKLTIVGYVADEYGKPVPRAMVKVLYQGEELAVYTGAGKKSLREVETASDGSFNLWLYVDREKIKELHIEIFKPSFRVKEIRPTEVLEGEEGYYAYLEPLILKREVGPAFYVSALILVLIYVLISLEIMHRTLAALLGAALMLIVSYTIGSLNPSYYILSYESAVEHVDWNVIFLLMGMMIIVSVMKRTGVFQWLAYKSYATARGDVWRLAVILMLVTGVVSAFIDNVTTMLLLTPITIEIALVLRISPLSLLIPEILASNIGGAATLIGDPPNIMIGSYAGLTFNDFVINLTPPVAIAMLALLGMMRYYYGDEYRKASIKDVDKMIEELRLKYQITDRVLLNQCMIILGVVISLFVLHGNLRGYMGEMMEVSIPALIGAAIAVMVSRQNIVEVLEDVEWPTLLFFIGLFMIVGATVETGVIDMIAGWVRDLSGGSLIIAVVLVIWVSAIASAFVDNIPFTATMLPIVAYLTETLGAGDVLWWALALGACLGGNGTYVGASANVVTIGLAERAGHPVGFLDFLKVGMPVTMVTVFIAMAWILIMRV
jgi:Na+/H+ antiporter NhaD/arsenite permease-like protein